jgi:hypothetical protein
MILILEDDADRERYGQTQLPQQEPLLGLATTEQLFRELITRFTVAGPDGGNWARTILLAEMLGGLGAQEREYRTVDS